MCVCLFACVWPKLLEDFSVCANAIIAIHRIVKVGVYSDLYAESEGSAGPGPLVCVECLIGKQKKPIFKVRAELPLSRSQYADGTPRKIEAQLFW